MTVEKLERVMWRIRSEHPNTDSITNAQLKKTIMKEIGTDPRTHRVNRAALIALGWLRSKGSTQVKLTGKDLTETH